MGILDELSFRLKIGITQYRPDSHSFSPELGRNCLPCQHNDPSSVAQGGGGGSVAPPDDLWLPSSLQHCLPLDLPKLSEKVTSAGCFQEICPELLSYLLS